MTGQHTPDPREAALRRLRDLGSGWVGFDDSHHYGDAVLKAIGPDVLNALDAAAQDTEPCAQFGEHPRGGHAAAVRESAQQAWETESTPRCQYLSPSPWGPTQCALPADHDGRHAYSPSES